MKDHPANEIEVFVKINEHTAVSEDKLHLNMDVVAVNNAGKIIPNQKIILELAEKRKMLVTPEGGLLQDYDVVFQCITSMRNRLKAWADGSEGIKHELDIVPAALEETIRQQMETALAQKDDRIREIAAYVAEIEPLAQKYQEREKSQMQQVEEQNNALLRWIKQFYDEMQTVKPDWEKIRAALNDEVLQKIKFLHKPSMLVQSFNCWIVHDDVMEVSTDRTNISRGDAEKYLKYQGLTMLERKDMCDVLRKNGLHNDRDARKERGRTEVKIDLDDIAPYKKLLATNFLVELRHEMREEWRIYHSHIRDFESERVKINNAYFIPSGNPGDVGDLIRAVYLQIL